MQDRKHNIEVLNDIKYYNKIFQAQKLSRSQLAVITYICHGKARGHISKWNLKGGTMIETTGLIVLYEGCQAMCSYTAPNKYGNMKQSFYFFIKKNKKGECMMRPTFCSSERELAA